ncbi:LOW QUALITY PROTEIN: hypothetical protein QYF61_007503 [Mycteria americana]|uniref:Uncharacterized protein n=1 Tax=Mycteria americana TaxID=33587 RepID=A0AAN7NY06_MYCAM|nr:LOW QUALITY PROTEIN: hypothetical protein QYF61_007503 [Mycteria americana]
MSTAIVRYLRICETAGCRTARCALRGSQPRLGINPESEGEAWSPSQSCSPSASPAESKEHLLCEVAAHSPARLAHTGCGVNAASATWLFEDADIVHADGTASRDSLSLYSEMQSQELLLSLASWTSTDIPEPGYATCCTTHDESLAPQPPFTDGQQERCWQPQQQRGCGSPTAAIRGKEPMADQLNNASLGKAAVVIYIIVRTQLPSGETAGSCTHPAGIRIADVEDRAATTGCRNHSEMANVTPQRCSGTEPGKPANIMDFRAGRRDTEAWENRSTPERIFLNIQSKPPLVQLEAISSCPIACYLAAETDPHLSTTSFQAVVESDKVSPQPPILQTKQPQFPQPLLIRLLLQTLHQLRCPSLDTLQHLNVSLVDSSAEYRGTIPTPAGHAIFDTSQDAIGFLGHLGTLLAHIQPALDQHLQVLFLWAAFQPLCPKPVALHGVAVAQVQDLALGLVEPHTIGFGPSIQPVQVPLQSLPPLKQINTPTQLGVTCKLTEGALDPFVQIIDKDNWPQHRALGNTACDRPPTGFNSIHNSLGPAIQTVFYPAKRTLVQAISSQFLQENAVGNGVKGFTEV